MTVSVRARAGQTQMRILEAAAQSLAKFGFARVRIDDVAEAAGVSRALVHRYFGDKTTLLRHVREHVLEEWSTAVDRGIAAAPDARAAIVAWLEASLAYAARQPLLNAIFSEEAVAATGLADPVTLRAADRRRSRVRALLERGVAEGLLPAELDLLASTEALIHLHAGLTNGIVRDGPISPISAERWSAEAVRILVAGLAR